MMVSEIIEPFSTTYRNDAHCEPRSSARSSVTQRLSDSATHYFAIHYESIFNFHSFEVISLFYRLIFLRRRNYTKAIEHTLKNVGIYRLYRIEYDRWVKAVPIANGHTKLAVREPMATRIGC